MTARGQVSGRPADCGSVSHDAAGSGDHDGAVESHDMNRRKSLVTLAALGAAAALPGQPARNPIQLHVDLDVDPAKEKEVIANFHKIFSKTMAKQPGFVEVKLMKLRGAVKGAAPANASHRLMLSFQTEELRLKWVASDDHQRVWPTIENHLRGAKFSAVLYDVV